MPADSVPPRPSRCRAAFAAVALAGCASLAGCAKNSDPYRVTGTVTFRGTPVAFGRVYFDPDRTTNPDSPQGFADIRDGRYDTASGGRGTRGGAFTARIEAFDGRSSPAFPYGQLLFDDYRAAIDLPAEDTHKDFDIPASAARKGPAIAP